MRYLARSLTSLRSRYGLSSAINAPKARWSSSASSSGPKQVSLVGLLAISGGAAAALFAATKGFVPHEWLVQHLADPIGMPLLRLLDPETSHNIAIKSASYGLIPRDEEPDPELLHIDAFGKTFTNPIGLAAGFDKNAEAMEALLDLGFGFVEIGSVTPEPQPGNERPRMFRLTEDNAVINRYGFNSDGIDAVQARLHDYTAMRTLKVEKPSPFEKDHRPGPLGVNLGKNKTTEDAASDYIKGVTSLGKYADYLVVNVSSPNTPGLRTLQGKEQLKTLLKRVLEARKQLEASEDRTIPLLVKIAPDLTDVDKKDIADVVTTLKVDGLIVSNTTLSRPNSLQNDHKQETGGLSGAPLRDLSTKVLSEMYTLTNGQVPLIGVGGVATGKDAYDKILAGATLVQMYSCLVFEGPSAVMRAKKELAQLLERDGYKHVSDAIGAGTKK